MTFGFFCQAFGNVVHKRSCKPSKAEILGWIYNRIAKVRIFNWHAYVDHLVCVKKKFFSKLALNLTAPTKP